VEHPKKILDGDAWESGVGERQRLNLVFYEAFLYFFSALAFRSSLTNCVVPCLLKYFFCLVRWPYRYWSHGQEWPLHMRAEFRTAVKKATLYPKWNASCKFYIPR
jgi:hypothetical protein